MPTKKPTRKELKAKLDELGVEYKAKATLAELEKLLAEAGETPEGAATDPEEEARVEQRFVTVQAPPSWARNNWNPPFLTTPLRFDRHSRAELCVEQAGEPVVFEFMGPQGLEQVPIADKVAEHPDLEVVE